MLPEHFHDNSLSDHSHGWKSNRLHHHEYSEELNDWISFVEDASDEEFSNIILRGLDL